jgi:hypothetical protein
MLAGPLRLALSDVAYFSLREFGLQEAWLTHAPGDAIRLKDGAVVRIIDRVSTLGPRSSLRQTRNTGPRRCRSNLSDRQTVISSESLVGRAFAKHSRCDERRDSRRPAQPGDPQLPGTGKGRGKAIHGRQDNMVPCRRQLIRNLVAVWLNSENMSAEYRGVGDRVPESFKFTTGGGSDFYPR